VNAVNVFLTVTMIAIIAYILFRPSNKSQAIISALGGASRNWIRTLSGQYEGGAY